MEPLFDTEIDRTIVNLNIIEKDREYYYFELIGKDGKTTIGTQTYWCSFTTDEPMGEIRKPRKVYGQFSRLLEETGIPYATIHDICEIALFFRLGGVAFVDAIIMEDNLPSFLEESVSYQKGRLGFVGRSQLNENAFKRAPTPKLRMEILNRDRRKCRICGRSPDTNVDIQLHVHHIRLWAKGGVTDPSNLITLCHTCHTGLSPHFDPTLYSYIDDKSKNSREKRLSSLRKGVIEHRRIWTEDSEDGG